MHKKLENLVALQGETVFVILIFNVEKCLAKPRRPFPGPGLQITMILPNTLKFFANSQSPGLV